MRTIIDAVFAIVFFFLATIPAVAIIGTLFYIKPRSTSAKTWWAILQMLVVAACRALMTWYATQALMLDIGKKSPPSETATNRE